MSNPVDMAPRLKRVERGEGEDELHLVLEDGTVIIRRAHGVHGEEAARTRERAVAILTTALAPGGSR